MKMNYSIHRSMFPFQIMVLVLFAIAQSTVSFAAEKEVGSRADGASVFVGRLVSPSIKAKIVDLKEVMSVMRYSVSHDPNDIVASKRLFLRLESKIEILELRKYLLDFVSAMATESGGTLKSSEVGFPPATFSFIAEFNDGFVKLDCALSKAEGNAFDMVVFIGRFSKERSVVGEQPGGPAQPATKLAEKVPPKDQPSTPTSKDAPR